MRHKIFNHMKTYQGFIFTVSGGSFFNGQRKPALSPNNWKLFNLIYCIWGSNTSFEFFLDFSASSIEYLMNMMMTEVCNLMRRNW